MVSEAQEFSRFYCMTASHKSHLQTISVTIMSYRGDSTNSEQWMDEEKRKIPRFFNNNKGLIIRTHSDVLYFMRRQGRHH